jgi:hypothetical protein
MFPLAYLITFHGYGTRLHGAPEGSVHHSRAAYGTDTLPEMPSLELFEEEQLAGPPFVMSYADAHVALLGVIAACKKRKWELVVSHARTTHVHSVISAEAAPEPILNAIKGYATRGLNKTHPEDRTRTRWSRHGSTPYLWEPADVNAAIEYVLYEQGEPMAVYKSDAVERWAKWK